MFALVRILSLALALAALSSGARASCLGAPTTVNFRNLGTFTTDTLVIGELTVTASTSPNVSATVNLLNLNGMGVVGGLFSETLDESEGLRFTFAGAARSGVTYSNSIVGDSNGNGIPGESLLKAFDAAGSSLGVVPVDGLHHDVSSHFGGVPISAFEIRAAGDTQRIGSVEFTTEDPTLVEFGILGDFTTGSLSIGDLTVTASKAPGKNGQVSVLDSFQGLGVVGGFSETQLDESEGLRFSFAGAPRSHVKYRVSGAGDLNENGLFGEALLEAFDAGGTSLGVVPVDGLGPGLGGHDVSAHFGGAAISAFEIRSDGDVQRIRSVQFDDSPMAGFSRNAYTLDEAGVIQDAELTIVRSGPSQCSASVTLSLAGGSATPGVDFDDAAFPINLTLEPGVTILAVPVPILQDSAPEPTEDIQLVLQANDHVEIGASSATIMILDDDEPAAVPSLGRWGWVSLGLGIASLGARALRRRR